jgi:mono/diheme cytochrome c family protein
MQQNYFSKLCQWFIVAVTILSANAIYAADIEAGKAKVAQQCAECHRPKDWSGETTAALESLIKDIVAGKVKHSPRKLSLTPQEVADIAAYWTSGRK